MEIEAIVGATHGRTSRLGIREIVRRLNTALGPTLVAALAGAKDPKISHPWARIDGPEPRDEAQARLVLAHRAWQIVAAVEGEQVARLWFVGSNPHLGEVSPVEAISQNRAAEVIAAATGLIEDGLAG